MSVLGGEKVLSSELTTPRKSAQAEGGDQQQEPIIAQRSEAKQEDGKAMNTHPDIISKPNSQENSEVE